MTTGNEHLTTEEVQQIIQKETDTARNAGRSVDSVTFHLKDGSDIEAAVHDVGYFKGRYVFARYDGGVEYIPVENIGTIEIKYEQEDKDGEDEEKGK